MLLLNRELLNRAKLCMVSEILSKIVLPKIRNLPRIFLRSSENVGPGSPSDQETYWTYTQHK